MIATSLQRPVCLVNPLFSLNSENRFTSLRLIFYYSTLRCFDNVFQRPYRYFSIDLKVFFSLYDRYKIFTCNWLWIEICENVVLSKIDITITTITKNFEIE